MGCCESRSFFQPITPPTHLPIKEDTATDLSSESVSLLRTDAAYIQKVKFMHIETKSGNKIILMLLQPIDISSPFIIYSHANNEDLGMCFSNTTFTNYFGNILKKYSKKHINIVTYEYSGYGYSIGGSATEKTLFEDILAIYNYISVNFPNNEIILYGVELGAAVSILLAKYLQDQAIINNCLAIILESPFLSAMKSYCICDTFMTYFCRVCCDFLDNETNILNIRYPIFICDNSIRFNSHSSHSSRLIHYTYSSAHVSSYFISNIASRESRTYNIYSDEVYIEKLSNFLNEVQLMHS